MTPSGAAASGRTLLWGGGLLALGGLVWALAELDSSFLHVASATVWQLASSVLLLVAAIILATGLRGDRGIAGPSAIGMVALILVGVRNPVVDVMGLVADALYTANGTTSVAVVATTTVLIFLFAVATVIAGIAVIRSGVVRGFARGMLVSVGCCYLLLAALTIVPLPVDAYPAAALLGIAPPALLIATGASCALQGRRALTPI